MTGARLTMATVRDAARKRVDETSLRDVADEIGMSFSGLRSFLKGGSPQPRTREKLLHWYNARAEHDAGTPREDLKTALAVIHAYVNDESKPRAVRERRRREIIDGL